MEEILRESWRVMPDTMATRLAAGGWQAAPHLRLVSYFAYLAGVGKIRRVAVQMPPGHGKSELISKWVPLWLLENYPQHRIILASYETTFAEEWGKAVKALVEQHQHLLKVKLDRDATAANRWRTHAQGGMWTVGAGGAITGRRANLFIVDDPHKNFAEAHSPSLRNHVWNWYTSTARTRLLPGGSVIVIQTRWHEDDLTGRLLQNMSDDTMWISIRLPAVAEQDETIETVVGERTVRWMRQHNIPVPKWFRQQGEPLWPSLQLADGSRIRWYDIEELETIRREVGDYVWEALYQQQPSSREGGIFDPADWQYTTQPPGGMRLVRRFDLAASSHSTADWTAAVLMGRDSQGDIYILDISRIRGDSKTVEQFMRSIAEQDRRRYGYVPVKLEQEPGASGKSWAKYLCEQVLAGYPATAEKPSGSKTTRVFPLAAAQQQHRVHLVVDETGWPQWVAEFIEEARMFPNGPHDDMVDAAAAAFIDLSDSNIVYHTVYRSPKHRTVPEIALT